MKPMQKIKLVVAVVAAVITLIIVLQNTEPVVTRVLFATIEMPRAVLLFGTSAVGFLMGVLVSMHLSGK